MPTPWGMTPCDAGSGSPGLSSRDSATVPKWINSESVVMVGVGPVRGATRT
jgi:hypothetical protein